MTNGIALEAVFRMNRNHELHEKLDVLLESMQAKFISELIDLAYEQIVKDE